MKKQTFWILFALILALAGLLRLYKLDRLPPGLYWEEVALGYDAYSILQTGRDHHGHPWPIVAFESFGDWKPALYFYVLVPFVWLLGLTEWAVRLPAALSGIAIVVGVGVLSRLMVKPKKKQDQLQLVTMVVTAISPWAILFSRAAWEVNLATALILWGTILFWRGLKSHKSALGLWLASAILLGLSMYVYHAARIVAPLLGLGLAGLALAKKKAEWLQLLLVAVAAFILVTPILTSLGQSATQQRFAETTIFLDLSVIEDSNRRKERVNNVWWSRLVYHRYLLFGQEILINFFDHFQADFLFISGDNNPRHSIQYQGQLYYIEAIFLLLGSYALIKSKHPEKWFLAWWLVVGILPSALTKTTPHALRILPTLPIWMLVIGLGIDQVLQLVKKYQRWLIIMILLVYSLELIMFWRFYTQVYPYQYAAEWQVGYKQQIIEIEQQVLVNPGQTITVSRDQGRPAMYYWFYTQTDPRQVQAVNAEVKKDQGEFLEFKNLRFE